ncbi:SH3 domain-containing protein [Flavobacterium psychroterrae]|uniref:SH3 domain-containing protein n=1 Tax=Flavobacterium psychroterrae TaxID=2133767 RepID=A0ABS5PA54_9FLAO|nr:SH3 domain-containing protein [Flavobacterium psychroterrae]MBS7231161.1 SH3 domain-containing protein [Flavobacterium psychroterrae]
MMLSKYTYILLILLNISCQGQDNKKNNIEKKEIEMFTSVLNKSNYKNTKENFENVNKDIIGIDASDLKEGYNDINILDESIDYQISKEGRYIKIGSDILPDIDNIKEDKLISYPYMKSLINLNKILYLNDVPSILGTSQKDIDLARDIVVLFNYEKNESFLKKVSDNIGDWDDFSNNFKLSIVFYNKDHAIRKKVLKYLSKNQELIYHITFYLEDKRKDIIKVNKLSTENIDEAIAYLLNLGLNGKSNADIDTDNDMSYRLLNNILIAHPKIVMSFEKNDYYRHEDLRFFVKVFHTMQENNDKLSDAKIYYIQDPDGFTNLRKDKNGTSDIIQKIKSGEKIDVLDDSGNWWFIQTKSGNKGYVYKTKIKTGNS